MDNIQNNNSPLLAINMYMLEYAHYVKSIDYTSILTAKSEYLNTITMTNLKLNNISTISELVSLRERINKLLDSCLLDIRDKERKFKLITHSKQKPILDLIQSIKTTHSDIAAAKESELNTISQILDEKLEIDNFVDLFTQKIDELQSNISYLQAEFSNLKNLQLYKDFELDKQKIITNAKKYRNDMKEFDEYILSVIPNSKLISRILSSAKSSDLYISKNNYDVLNKTEFSDLKIQFENIISISMPSIEKESNHISTFINNFLGDTATAFNNKWISIPQKTINNISREDQILLESELKIANAEIDKLSKRYGEFLDRIYDNYPKYLTEKVFSNININEYK